MESDYNRQCGHDFSLLWNRVSGHFGQFTADCPYGLPHQASFCQALFGPLADRAMELFLAAGFRRNGNVLYTMRCCDCMACIPIRIRATAFQPNRNQRRTMKKNQDLTISFHPLVVDEEHRLLCDRFLAARYPGSKENSGAAYYQDFFCNTMVNSMCIDLRLDGKLLGASIIDLGENWMNAVYFYFDPEERQRSLGTFNIVTLVDICLDMGISFLYLGYYIEGIAAMRYKKHFKPHQLFVAGGWQDVS